MIRLDIAAAITEIRRGVSPWMCLVEFYPLEGKLRCQVVDISGKPIINDLCLSSTDAVEPGRLRGAIHRARAKLEEEGFALEQWALELKRHLGVCYKSAWLMKHKLMEVMRQREDSRVLDGRVEIDDAYLVASARGSRETRTPPSILKVCVSLFACTARGAAYPT